MLRIENITQEAYQRHSIIFEDFEIVLSLRYLHKCAIWIADIEYIDFSVNGIKLSTGVLHIAGQNQPFDFIVTDESDNGIDPYKQDDFSSDRCRLFLLERTEVEEIRGVELP